MLKQLRYKATFRNPVKTLEGNHTFESGLTGITGPNGKGKSFILEMVDYALHGTEALRGKADDYEVLEVNLDFELKGRLLYVERTKNKATLWERFEDKEDTPLASGTKPVNQKIEELFGYSSDVFRMANLCQQGKIEELGLMKPTERKRLVDETIGLNVLDQVTEFIDSKRKDLTTGIKAIESVLVAPVEPTKPLVEGSAADHKIDRDRLAVLRDERNVLQGAAMRPLYRPAKPDRPTDVHLLGQYRAELSKRTALLTEYTVLDREMKAIPIVKGPLVDKLHDQDAQYDGLLSARQRIQMVEAEIAANEKNLAKHTWSEPVIPAHTLDEGEARLKTLRRWEQREAIRARNVPHDCPKCHHHWEDEDPRLKTDFADVPDQRPDVPYTEQYLTKERMNLMTALTWGPVKAQVEKLKEELAAYKPAETIALINEIELTRKMYQQSQQARDNEKRRRQLETQLKKLSEEFQGIPDNADRVTEIEAFNLRWTKYQVELQAYDKTEAEVKEAQEKLKGYADDLDLQLAGAEQNYMLAFTYENSLDHYQKAKELYDTSVAKLAELKTELLEWTNARQAVVDMRAKVKGYLLPSLNTVASLLISQMTGGELSIINVDENFDITVDGQRLETLSGAGKAVANLALRIGLGQVLTNRVFSVMMLDEIDASCDDDRAAYIAACLKNLTKTISQVLLVSHKAGLEADHHVRL